MLYKNICTVNHNKEFLFHGIGKIRLILRLVSWWFLKILGILG